MTSGIRDGFILRPYFGQQPIDPYLLGIISIIDLILIISSGILDLNIKDNLIVNFSGKIGISIALIAYFINSFISILYFFDDSMEITFLDYFSDYIFFEVFYAGGITIALLNARLPKNIKILGIVSFCPKF